MAFLNKFINLLSSKYPLCIPVGMIIFFTIAFLFSPSFFIYSDFLHYFGIAERYANGDISNAINAYWSPLLCWLLIPITFVKSLALEYMLLLNAISMVFILVYANKILKYYALDNILKQIGLCAISFYFLLFAQIKGPDLMVVTFLSILFYLTLDMDKINKNYISIAVVGLVLFFAKSYNFYFFLFYIVLQVLKFSVIYKKFVFNRFLKIGVLFISVALIWIGILYSKYRTTMVSSVGQYAHAIAVPGNSIHGLDTAGLLYLPYPTAYSFAEDLAQANPKQDWSPFDTPAHFTKQINILTKNIINIKDHIVYQNIWILVALCTSLISFFIYYKKRSFQSLELNAIVFGLAYISGYIVVSFEPRHIFIVFILGIFIVLGQANIIHQFKIRYNYSISIGFVFIMALFCLRPLRQHLYTDPVHPQLKTQAVQLSTQLKPNYKLASSVIVPDIIPYLVFISNGHYYGYIDQYKDSTSLVRALSGFSIDYVLLQKHQAQQHFYFKNKIPAISSDTLYMYKAK